jgi:NAD(P)-dependent dehydrogenase (short-subunit alcohol dehydrogenase family)
LSVNVKGVWLCMKYELQQMLRQGAGAIVNQSSVAGLVGVRRHAAYVASKHAVVGLTCAAALEYADRGIRINSVCPGPIRTAMLDQLTGGSAAAESALLAAEPIGRFGRPEEVAEAVLWLCSSGSSYVVGHALVVDGGWTVG